MRIGYIYKIYCLDDAIKECYIGSCWYIKNRMSCHKYNCSTINRAEYNYKLYTFIRDNGGWCNWDYEYYMVNVIDKTDLQMQEQERIDIEVNPILNGRRAYTNKLDYNKQYLKQYRIDNRENTKKFNCKKNNCPCGGKYTTINKAKHFRTLQHQNYINQV